MILSWHDTGVSVSFENRMEHAYAFAGCIMTETVSGDHMRRLFFSPDGHRFIAEQKLIKYMDKKYGLQKSGGDCKTAH